MTGRESARQALASRERSRRWPWSELAHGKAASVGGLFIPNVTYWQKRRLRSPLKPTTSATGQKPKNSRRVQRVRFRVDSDPKCTAAESVEAACRNVIQALEARARIMRYELTDHEWTAIKSAG
jgi:hypothetical protein